MLGKVARKSEFGPTFAIRDAQRELELETQTMWDRKLTDYEKAIANRAAGHGEPYSDTPEVSDVEVGDEVILLRAGAAVAVTKVTEKSETEFKLLEAGARGVDALTHTVTYSDIMGGGFYWDEEMGWVCELTETDRDHNKREF